MEHLTASATATIERDRLGITLVRFRGPLKLSKAVVTEVMQAWREPALGTCAVIVIIPEHTEYDMDLLAVDHYSKNGLEHRTEALAIVCHELGLVPMLRLYFAYHPPPFALNFCASVDEAKSWMRQRAGRGAVA